MLDFAHPKAAVDFLLETAGHVLAERPRLEAEGRWEELMSELGALVDERDEREGGPVSLRLEYLVVVARAGAASEG